MTGSGSAGIVIQARMGSTRLPGKVAEWIGGMPALVLQLRRVAVTGLPVVVATSELPRDDRVVELAADAGVPVVRGSEEDVLDRFVTAASFLGTEHVVRLTGDCPLTDPALVEAVLGLHLDVDADYTSNVLPRTFPKGLDVEVVRTAVLITAAAEATERPDREHVLPFIYRRPGRFRLANFAAGTDWSHERWTLDTPEDLSRLRAVAEACADPVAAPLEELLERAGRPAPILSRGLRLRVTTQTDVAAGGVPSSSPGDDPWVRSWVLADGDHVVAGLRAATGPPGGVRTVEPLLDDPSVDALAHAALDDLLTGDQQLRL